MSDNHKKKKSNLSYCYVSYVAMNMRFSPHANNLKSWYLLFIHMVGVMSRVKLNSEKVFSIIYNRHFITEIILIIGTEKKKEEMK